MDFYEKTYGNHSNTGYTLVFLSHPVKKNEITDIHFLMINDTHGEFVSSDGAPGVEQLATLVKKVEKENGQVIPTFYDLFSIFY